MKILLFLIVFIFLFSCEEGSENNKKFVCINNSTEKCTCENGKEGIKTCKENKWLECKCENDENFCKDVDCLHGVCKVKDDKAYCECDEGYVEEDLKCIKKEEDLCKNFECNENSHCEIKENEPKCLCNEGFVSNGENCIFDCSNIENSHVNDTNDGCDCDDGYHKENNLCIENEDFKCRDYTCGDNSHCEVENGEPICKCNDGYTENGGICVIDCSAIENSHSSDDNTECICNDNFHKEDSKCISNVKTVPCKSVTPPLNAHVVEEVVTIVWNNQTSSWSEPENCDWECNEGYQDNDNDGVCKEACGENSCENAVCDDSLGVIECNCNEGYQDNDGDNICKPDCRSTEVSGKACGGYGTCFDDTGEVYCICDDGYQDYDGDGFCKEACYTNILAPELSTCGANGTCSDSGGEIICNCDDGYFWDIESNKCVSPCENVDCGGHGECNAFDMNTIYCVCDDGYQDNGNVLICKKSCEDSCAENASGCDDSTGELICSCNDGYQDNDRDGTCNPDCSDESCNGNRQIHGSCNDESGYAVCSYVHGYNYTDILSGSGNLFVNDSVVDSKGNLYLVGSFTGSTDFNPSENQADIISSSGEDDVFVTRINADGSYAWTYHVGSYGKDGAQAVAIDDNDNLYIAGYFTSTVDFDDGTSDFLMRSNALRDIFIIKITNHKEFLNGYSILSDDTGLVTSLKVYGNSLYLTGYLLGDNDPSTNLSVDFDKTSNNGNFEIKGRQDGFIVKYVLSNGFKYRWAKIYGYQRAYNNLNDITKAGNKLFLTGKLSGIIDFDGEEGNTLGDIDSGYKPEAFLLILNENGEFIKIKEFISDDFIDYSEGVKIKNDTSYIYLAGNIQGNVNFGTVDSPSVLHAGDYNGVFILKIDENGDIIKKSLFKAVSDESNLRDIELGNGKVYVLLTVKGSINILGNNLQNTHEDSQSDIVMSIINSEFTNSENFMFGGDGNDIAKSISVGENGEIYILGTFEETADFAPGNEIDSKTSMGMSDLFISRYTD